MRKIAATYIFPGNGAPIKNGILICGDDGKIIGIEDNGGRLNEEAGMEFYSGILAPGFINAHCHLELSHLHAKIEEKGGIGRFIGSINRLRDADAASIERAAGVADKRLYAEGIAAVGDISNSSVSLETKANSSIHYHTFVEVFGFHPSRAERAFSYAMQVMDEFRESGLDSSIVPHSPYSVSAPLFNKVTDEALKENSILTIHNQESVGERQFFIDGTGPISDHLVKNLGIDTSHWNPPGKSSLQSVLKILPEKLKLLLVHNTFTMPDDLDVLKKRRPAENTWLVLCPNSNLYIENKLPPVPLFREYGMNICLGTDSLASNHKLSILEEMITLQQNFPELTLRELIRWATINGAEALGISSSFGSFDNGKIPGAVLISGVDFNNMKLTASSRVKRLL